MSKESDKILKANKQKKAENTVPFITNRWKRIFDLNDSRMIWKAIGWNGELTEESSEVPSDLEFKIHFEELLNPVGLEDSETVQSNINIPLLDNAIDSKEVEEAVSSLNGNKSYIGVDTGS